MATIITVFGIKTAFLCWLNLYLIRTRPSQKIKKLSAKSRNKEVNNHKLCAHCRIFLSTWTGQRYADRCCSTQNEAAVGGLQNAITGFVTTSIKEKGQSIYIREMCCILLPSADVTEPETQNFCPNPARVGYQPFTVTTE